MPKLEKRVPASLMSDFHRRGMWRFFFWRNERNRRAYPMTPLRTPRGKSDARGADVFRAVGVFFEAAMQRVEHEQRKRGDVRIMAYRRFRCSGSMGFSLVMQKPNGIQARRLHSVS